MLRGWQDSADRSVSGQTILLRHETARVLRAGGISPVNGNSDTTRQAEAEAAAALSRAREAESAWVEAREKVRDAATLRLFVVEQELRPFVSAMPEARGLIELALVPGFPPRLWIDLSAYVIVDENDGRTLRLVQETLEERRVLFSTERVEEMAGFLKRFIAHRVARRHRMLAGCEVREAETPRPAGERPDTVTAPSAGAVWLAWLAGVVSGMLLLALFLLVSGRIDTTF
jgi:hypothetical protein